MNDDQIIEMACQVEHIAVAPDTYFMWDESDIIAFARLIAEKQREEDARICIDLMARVGFSDFHFEAGDQCAAAIRNSGGAA
jgi:hypothetical protein